MSKTSKSKRISIASSNSGYSAGLGEISRAFSSDSVPINGTRNSQLIGGSKIPRPPSQFPISPPQLDPSSFGAQPSKLKAPQSTLRNSLGSVKKSSTSTTTTNSPKISNQPLSPTNSLKLNLNIPLGSKVIAPRENLIGTLRYLGQTKFKEGIWAGIELDQEGTGKNDGSVMGVTYFKCKPKTGIFIDSKSVCLKEGSEIPESKPIIRRIERIANGQRPASMYALNNVNKKPNGAQPIPTLKNGSIERPPFKTRASYTSDLEANLLGSENSPRSRNLMFMQRLTPSSEELGTSLAELYNSNAPPEQIIQTLNTQLVTLKKKNELLKIRLSHKRAQQQADHVLKTELIDKARLVVQNRRSSQNSQDQAALDLVKVVAEKEEKIKDLIKQIENLRVSPGQSLINLVQIEEEKKRLNLQLSTKISAVESLEHSIELLRLRLEEKEIKVNELEGKVAELQNTVEPKAGDQPSADLIQELEALKSASSLQISELQQSLQQTQQELESALERKHDVKSELENIVALEEQLILKNAQISELECSVQNLTELNKLIGQQDATHREFNESGSSQANEDLVALVEELRIKIETLELENSDLKEQIQDEDVVPAHQFNDLKHDKESYIQTIEGLQVDKENLTKQVATLNVTLNDMKEGKANWDAQLSEDSHNVRLLEAKSEKLEVRVKELEDELMTSRSLNDKAIEGTLSADDVKDDLKKQVKQRDATIIKLEARISDLEQTIVWSNEDMDNLVIEKEVMAQDLEKVCEELSYTYDQFAELEQKFNALTQAHNILTGQVSKEDPNSKTLAAIQDLKQHYETENHDLKEQLKTAGNELEENECKIKELEERCNTLQDDLNKVKGRQSYDAYDLDPNVDRAFCYNCYLAHDSDNCPNPKPDSAPIPEDADLLEQGGSYTYSLDETALLEGSRDLDLSDDVDSIDMAMLEKYDDSDLALVDELDFISY